LPSGAALADANGSNGVDPRQIDADKGAHSVPRFSFASEPLPRLIDVEVNSRAARDMGIGSGSGLAALALALLAASQLAGAQKPSHDEQRARDSDICGYQLMTERERAQYRERLERGGTGAELDRIVNEHREQMTARAKERGVVLSCDKPGEVRQIKTTQASKSERGGVAPPVVAVRANREGESDNR
jgi:hypothetical protein